MAKFQAMGYETLVRNSENKVFTHATVFVNKSDDSINASFHISLKSAQTDALTINKRSHIDVIEIVEVVKVGN